MYENCTIKAGDNSIADAEIYWAQAKKTVANNCMYLDCTPRAIYVKSVLLIHHLRKPVWLAIKIDPSGSGIYRYEHHRQTYRH